MSSEFPPNSAKSKAPPHVRPESESKPRVERITSSEPKRRKKGLGRQFKETFIRGDAKTALHFMVFDSFVPTLLDALVEAGQNGIERLILGDSRRKSSASRPGGGTIHYNPYNRFSNKDDRPPRPSMTARGRAMHDFEEIVLDNRGEAQAALDQMYEILEKYEVVSVSELYTMVGIRPTHVDTRWGWTDLRGSGVVRIRGGGGYLLDLPDPEAIA